MLVKILRYYHSTVTVEANGNMASGNSIWGMLTLAAGYGVQITFTIVGEDASQAMAAVHHLFDACFEFGRDASMASRKPLMPLTGATS